MEKEITVKVPELVYNVDVVQPPDTDCTIVEDESSNEDKKGGTMGKRGRPKGSKNKPKEDVVETPEVTTEEKE